MHESMLGTLDGLDGSDRFLHVFFALRAQIRFSCVLRYMGPAYITKAHWCFYMRQSAYSQHALYSLCAHIYLVAIKKIHHHYFTDVFLLFKCSLLCTAEALLNTPIFFSCFASSSSWCFFFIRSLLCVALCLCHLCSAQSSLSLVRWTHIRYTHQLNTN